jgi:superfamily I DNA and/or RNA helicase
MEIDNLVIDEGSMMTIQQLLYLASKVKKRIVISGDFRQLGPIALSKSSNAKKWLHKDLFSLLGNEDGIIKHSSIQMLKFQRRSAASIAELINHPFYFGELYTEDHKSHHTSILLPPTDGHVSFIDLPSDERNKVEYSSSRSKYNSLARHETMKLLKRIIDSDDSVKTVGIIAPYRQQVIDYRLHLQHIDTKSVSLRVGTIHTFQGSECDIIIWDIVDAFNESMGLLYLGQTGERLVNVAISRAKSKLIIVGSHRIFHECKGGDLVSIKIKRIISNAWELYLSKK